MLRYGSISLFHSTNRGNPVGVRDDVGIVPYERPGAHSIQPGVEINRPGRDDVGIVPYERPGAHSIQSGMEINCPGRDDVGIVPYKRFGGIS